ncbi:hypothetical protein [Mycobacterium sp. 852002-51057_SCH5723018]|uniref:hypothetical protein n=1 Tax=Mycobacterium sp. 852002-51057_SCH5723018 TaxID=1834094 RepID=UPI000ADE55F8|nr:hypothetical protein [Mycobacterium sp. 852002-51057_SCH5723018]
MTDTDNDHRFKEVAMDVMSVARAGVNALEASGLDGDGARSQLEGKRNVPGPNRTAHQPETVPALLRTLQVRQASATEEMDSLRGWLRHNTPNSSLRISFHLNGYGRLLGERFRGSNKRTTCEYRPY